MPLLPLLFACLFLSGCAGTALSRPIEGPGRCDACGSETDVARKGIVWTDGNFDATTTFSAWGPEGE